MTGSVDSIEACCYTCCACSALDSLRLDFRRLIPSIRHMHPPTKKHTTEPGEDGGGEALRVGQPRERGECTHDDEEERAHLLMVLLTTLNYHHDDDRRCSRRWSA